MREEGDCCNLVRAMKPLIVACTDFSPCSELALERAADIARQGDTRVLLVHVCGPKRGPATRAKEWGDRIYYDEAMGELRRARVKYFGELSDSDVQYDAVPSTHPASAICKVAKDHQASMIVVGSHGRTGMLRQLLGSVAEGTVRHAPCSVFVVREAADS